MALATDSAGTYDMIDKNKAKCKSITKAEARRITRIQKGLDVEIIKIVAKLPPNAHVYNQPKDCWWVYYRHPHVPQMLTSSTALGICRKTGKVRFNGSLGDEG